MKQCRLVDRLALDSSSVSAGHGSSFSHSVAIVFTGDWNTRYSQSLPLTLNQFRPWYHESYDLYSLFTPLVINPAVTHPSNTVPSLSISSILVVVCASRAFPSPFPYRYKTIVILININSNSSIFVAYANIQCEYRLLPNVVPTLHFHLTTTSTSDVYGRG